jgi:hypothetical protein
MGVINNASPFSLIVWGQTEIGAGLLCIDGRAPRVFRDHSTNVVAGLHTRYSAR